MTKEAAIGVVVLTAIVSVIGLAAGWYGVIYLGLALLVAILSIHLFTRKAVLSKSAAMVLNTDLIYKILMPRKYRKAIRELQEKEQRNET